MYYLNIKLNVTVSDTFFRTKFICIIWTLDGCYALCACSWGLSLFVLFELKGKSKDRYDSSWGLSLFVLFELKADKVMSEFSSWGLSLFVLFERSVWPLYEGVMLAYK